MLYFPLISGAAFPDSSTEDLKMAPSSPVYGNLRLTSPPGTRIEKLVSSDGDSALINPDRTGGTFTERMWGIENSSITVSLHVLPGQEGVLKDGTTTVTTIGGTIVGSGDVYVNVLQDLGSKTLEGLPGSPTTSDAVFVGPLKPSQGRVAVEAPTGTTINYVRTNSPQVNFTVSEDRRSARSNEDFNWFENSPQVSLNLNIDASRQPGEKLSGGSIRQYDQNLTSLATGSITVNVI